MGADRGRRQRCPECDEESEKREPQSQLVMSSGVSYEEDSERLAQEPPWLPMRRELLTVAFEHDRHSVPRHDVCRDEPEGEDEQRPDRRRHHERHGLAHGFGSSAALTGRTRKPPQARRAPCSLLLSGVSAARLCSLALSGLRSAPGCRALPTCRATLLLQALHLPLRSLCPSCGSLSGDDPRPQRVPARRAARLQAAEAPASRGGGGGAGRGGRGGGRLGRRFDRRGIRPRAGSGRRAGVDPTKSNGDGDQDERARLEPPRRLSPCSHCRTPSLQGTAYLAACWHDLRSLGIGRPAPA